jgi:3-oxoacyl-[acyl-carrier protein] reductase
MDLGLRNTVVLVTGGSAGIGLAAAELMAAEGAHVAIAARDRDRLNEAGRRLAAASRGGSKVVAITGDFSEPDVPARVVDEVTTALGPIDVLVNNVGLAYQARFEDLTDEHWDELWQLNVMSYVRSIQAVLPGMRRRKAGVIINVSSTAGKRPSAGMPNYSVTKAAVLSLSRLVADTYAGDGIRSVAICPGPTKSEAWLAGGGLGEQVAELKGISVEEALAATGKGRPMGRMAEPDEIAGLIAFAASARASYLTGAALSIDGGSVPVII